jgi:hypothetical protein
MAQELGLTMSMILGPSPQEREYNVIGQQAGGFFRGDAYPGLSYKSLSMANYFKS